MSNFRPDFRPDINQDKKVGRWMLILPAVLIAGLVLSLVVFNALYGRPNYTVGMYDTSRPVAAVHYKSAEWKPSGQPVAMADDQMVAVDNTDEGMMVYTTKSALEGGGGGRPEAGANPTAYGHLYLRTRDGKYQPLQRTK